MKDTQTPAPKKYDAVLVERVRKIRMHLGPQPLAMLWATSPDLRDDKQAHPKLRRILSYKVFPGDKPEVERLERARAILMKAQKK